MQNNQNDVPLEEALSIAQQHHQSGNLTLADRTYRDILKIVPDNYTTLHYLGILAYQRGNPQEGIEFLEKALKIDSEQPEAWNVYAVMLAQTGRNEDALKAWKSAIALKPEFFEVYSNIGNTLWVMGKHKESQEACEKAVAINPDFADSYINLGNALTAQGKDKEAIEKWQKTLELNPKSHNAYINIGNSLRNLGRIKESEEHCRKALEITPKDPDALLNLGNALRDQGQYKEAEELYRKSTEIRPSHAMSHNNLAIVLMDLLRFDEAVTAARYAIAFDPNNAEAYANMSIALRESGEIEQAEEAARQALRLDPDSAETRIDLADILFMSDRLDEAETLFNEAMELTPDSSRLYIKLSSVLERMNRTEEALEAIDKAVALSPEMPEVYHRQAMIHFMSHHIQKALASLEKALEIEPKFAAAMATKSEILQAHGDMEGARIAARKGLEINDKIPFIYYTLSKVKKFTEDDPDFIAMKELDANSEKYGKVQTMSLQYALFKAYENIGDYEKAFEHLKKGSDIKRSYSVFNEDMQYMIFKTITDTYTKEYIESFKGKGNDSDIPVFIVGMPRSGTTLTEQILSSHPDVFGAGELYNLSDVEQKHGLLNQENCKKLGDKYLDLTRAIEENSQKAKRITDKMPSNYMRIGQIVATLPNAKIIHCRRNPMDTCLSCYKQLFARGHYWSYNLKEMANYYKHYENMMAHWRKVLPKERFLEIDYEETVQNLERQARKLIDYAGLDWNEACLTPHKTKRSILTASKGQVRKPVYTSSIDAWKRYKKQLEPLSNELKEFME